MRLGAAVMMMALVAGPAQARPEATACITQRNTVEMIDCGRFLLERAEEDLAAVAAGAAQRLPDYAFNLEVAQTHWRLYRDAHCHFLVGLDDGGTIAPLNALACMRQETRRRMDELNSF